MPLSEAESRELLEKVREIHAAMLARRAASKPTVGHAVAAVTTPKQAHDPSDPVVKLQPRGWKGEPMIGKRYSECPPLFLGQLSHMLDSFADRNEQDPERQRYAKWDRENAEAARKWRAKLEGKADLFDSKPSTPTVEQLADEGAF